MEHLTEKQKKILGFIMNHMSKEGHAPTIREIASKFGITIGPVQRYLKALEKKGHLRHKGGLSRGIVASSHKPWVRVPLLGSVPAGRPTEAIEGIEDYIYLDKDIAPSGTYFALKVKGDSMTGAGIFEGDTVVVRHQPTAEDGEIVVAKVGGAEGTVKRLRKKGGAVWLHPENPRYEPIGGDIEISGKVVYLARKVR
ncbi:MAG: transcriptional repressor LexA [Endomicrobiales bacterium]|nr:transcriptional repressor LexA [Endomicrobiales bacterium]